MIDVEFIHSVYTLGFSYDMRIVYVMIGAKIDSALRWVGGRLELGMKYSM